MTRVGPIDADVGFGYRWHRLSFALLLRRCDPFALSSLDISTTPPLKDRTHFESLETTRREADFHSLTTANKGVKVLFILLRGFGANHELLWWVTTVATKRTRGNAE